MNAHEAFYAYADDEFDGESFNGPSFMKTLDGLSAETAAFKGTYEAYSAWEVAAHCLFYKYFLLKSLGLSGPIDPYPYEEGNFVGPVEVTDKAWADFRSYARKVHAACMETLRKLPEQRLGETMPEWKIPYGKVVAWLCGHNSYHCAQIRSMGVPGLKAPKKD